MKENSRDIDSELIKKAKKGNHGAFNILMNKYYPRVYASIFSFIKSKEDSEDLSQQTFIKVWQQLDTFRGDSAFFTWVYRIAINLAKNFVTSSGFKKQKSLIWVLQRVTSPRKVPPGSVWLFPCLPNEADCRDSR